MVAMEETVLVQAGARTAVPMSVAKEETVCRRRYQEWPRPTHAEEEEEVSRLPVMECLDAPGTVPMATMDRGRMGTMEGAAAAEGLLEAAVQAMAALALRSFRIEGQHK
jgi:hypothetical protein